MRFVAQLTTPEGKHFYVSAKDSEGLRYCDPYPAGAERFETRRQAQIAIGEIKLIRLVRDYRETIVEV